MPNWVTIKAHAMATGLSEKAIRAKIERGIWPEGIWKKARDGRIYVSTVAFDSWVEGQEFGQLGGSSRLTSAGRASGAGNG